MELTISVGQLIAGVMLVLAILGIAFPAGIRIGRLESRVDGHHEQISKLFAKIDELLTELRIGGVP